MPPDSYPGRHTALVTERARRPVRLQLWLLARWYQKRFGKGNSRMRKIGIVALARKLLIAFWRYLETGVVPEGAVLRA